MHLLHPGMAHLREVIHRDDKSTQEGMQALTFAMPPVLVGQLVIIHYCDPCPEHDLPIQGDGVPPAEARDFCDWLQSDAPAGMNETCFSVLALGDRYAWAILTAGVQHVCATAAMLCCYPFRRTPSQCRVGAASRRSPKRALLPPTLTLNPKPRISGPKHDPAHTLTMPPTTKLT